MGMSRESLPERYCECNGNLLCQLRIPAYKGLTLRVVLRLLGFSQDL